MAVSKINAAPLMGVYIHWPFCESKCPYCDFNSHVEDAIDHSRWRQALLTELSYFANDTNYTLGIRAPEFDLDYWPLHKEVIVGFTNRLDGKYHVTPEARANQVYL